MLESLVIGLHLISAHVPERPWHNDKNWGAYVETSGIAVGTYKNSLLGSRSYYVARRLDIWGPVSLHLGAISGYQVRYLESLHGEPYNGTIGTSQRKINPILAPSLKFDAIPLRLFVIPPAGKGSTVFHLTLEIPMRHI
jgi:hypothetical protein